MQLERLSRLAFLVLFAFGWMGASVAVQAQSGDVEKGKYIAQAGGCVGCHTNIGAGAEPYAGGRALKTPFGTFFGPNITPDRETGLGSWSQADSKRAIHLGEGRDGSHYFPAFPYPSFTGMNDADIRDLWAYLRSLPPIKLENKPHDLRFPFGWRFLVTIWKWLFFTPGAGGQTTSVASALERGAYLVRVLGHCGECHTPRNMFGASKTDHAFSGARIPEGKVPNLTPTGLKKWSDSDVLEYFDTGTTPSGDIAVEPMSEVITNTTSKLTKTDQAAIVAFLRSLRPLPNSE